MRRSPDIGQLRRLNEQEAAWNLTYGDRFVPRSMFYAQRLEYASRRAEQWRDPEFRRLVFEDWSKHELVGDNMGFRGHRDTWQGTEDLVAVPVQLTGTVGAVHAWEWKDHDVEGVPPFQSWSQWAGFGGPTFQGSLELPQDILARALQTPSIALAFGEVEWPEAPTFYFGNNGAKVEEDKLFALVEESRGLIFRSIDEAIHLLGNDTFG